MSALSVLVSRAPSGMFGVFRSWLATRSRENWQSSDVFAFEAAGSSADFSRSVCVLVVDDDPDNLVEIAALMEPRGLVLLRAADGAEAVALACELHFDLILMDLQMPILDGLRATSEIRRFETRSSRPAVPVIAYSNAAVGAGVLAMHGLNGCLRKPCGDEELDDCLVQWCPTYRPAAGLRDLARDNSAPRATGLRAGTAP